MAGRGPHDDDDDLAQLVAAAPQPLIPATAAFHRIEGCVHEALHGVEGVEPDVLASLAAARERAVRQHLVRVRALSRFGHVMAEAGVPWVVLKGVVLANLLYHDPGLRSSVDIDILVARPRLRAGRQGPGGTPAIATSCTTGRWSWSPGPVSSRSPTARSASTCTGTCCTRRATATGSASTPSSCSTGRAHVAIGGREVRTFDPVDTLCTWASTPPHRVVTGWCG